MSSDRYSAFRSSNYGMSDGRTISIDIQLSWDHIAIANLRYSKLMAIPAMHPTVWIELSHPSNSDHNSAFRFTTN